MKKEDDFKESKDKDRDSELKKGLGELAGILKKIKKKK